MVRKIIKSFYKFLVDQRRSGTSTLVGQVAQQHNVYLVVANGTEEQRFNREFPADSRRVVVTLGELEKLQGMPPRPILVDNFALLQVFETAHNELLHKEDQLEEVRKRLNLIEFKLAEAGRELATAKRIING